MHGCSWLAMPLVSPFLCSLFRQTGMSAVIGLCSYVFCVYMKLEDHVSEHQRSSELRVNPGDMCPFGCGQEVG